MRKEALLLDYTTASSLVCSTKAWLRHVQGLVMRGQVNTPMLVGIAMHEALETYLQTGDMTQAHNRLVSGYERLFAEPPQEERLQLANTALILNNWMAAHPIAQLPFMPVESEHEFQVQIPGTEVLFWGRIDLLGQYQDGSIYVVDHKTTARIDDLWRSQWSLSAQLMGYTWAMKQLHPELHIRGALVNAIEIPRLPPYDGNLQKKCQVHKVQYAECQPLHAKSELLGPFVYTETQLQQWLQSFVLQATRFHALRRIGEDQIVLLPMEGMYSFDMGSRGNACTTCMYKPFCSVGRPREALDMMFEREPWEPQGAQDA